MTQNSSSPVIQPGLRCFKSLVGIATLGMALAGTAHASVGIVSYNLLSASPTATAANVTASSIGTGAGITSVSYSGVIANSLFLVGTTPDNGAGPANLNNNYFQFTVTPAVGYALNLTSLTFNEGTTPSGGSVGYYIETSLDSFVGGDGTANNITGGPSLPTPVNVGLSGAAFQDVTTPLTVRVLVFSSVATSPPAFPLAVFNNLALNGSVTAVPEPTTLGLAVAGGLAWLGLRRRNA